jgi:predicted nucleotidyltransferase
MTDKPTTAAGYSEQQVELVRATCLYVATKLGDLMKDLVVVGGLVPSLLIDQTNLAQEIERHAGTLDLDIGLSLAVFDDEQYRTISDRFRGAGFEPDKNKQGKRTNQRWKIEGDAKMTVDFLIPPSREDDVGGRVRNLEEDFAALIVPGLHLAFRDEVTVTLSGQTIFGEKATREVRVCGPGAYVVLKAYAFAIRGENKDAYDLYYVVRNYGNGPEEVAKRFLSLCPDAACEEALDILRRDFLDPGSVGARRATEFLRGKGVTDDELQADVAGFVQSFVDHCMTAQS